MPSQLGGAPLCPVCEKRVYFNEEKCYMGRSWHKQCFKCGTCKKALESCTANLTDELLNCNSCQRKSQSKNGEKSAIAKEYINKDDAECCPRCGKKVYFAEQILSLGRKWHKLCFTCGSCSKKVSSTSAADHDGELYCKPCHTRMFGPKGYGFAGGASGLSMDTGNPDEISRENVPHTNEAYVAPVVDKMRKMSVEGENGSAETSGGARPRLHSGEDCPRCGQRVFIAEKRQGAGNVYHMTCFTCALCNKKLDASLTEKDGEIYCKNCYGKTFGPKGYGFGTGAGTLQVTE